MNTIIYGCISNYKEKIQSKVKPNVFRGMPKVNACSLSASDLAVIENCGKHFKIQSC